MRAGRRVLRFALPGSSRRARSGRTIGLLVGLVAVSMLAAACAAVAPKPLPPSVALEGVRVGRLTAADTRIFVALVVRNPNAYDLALSALDAELTLEGVAVLSGTLVAPALLVANGDTPVEIETRTTLVAVTAALERIARLAVVRYDVTGVAVVQDGRRLPFKRNGELSTSALMGRSR